MLLGAAGVLLGYLLGAIPVGFLLVRWQAGRDVRAGGSGSTGATNVVRALGLLWGLLTLVLDFGKGYAAVTLVARLAPEDTRWVAAAGLAAIVGHCFPVFLRFRGGKGVATAAGVFLYFAPLAVAAAAGVWLAVVAVWRYVSLGSLLAAASYPLLATAFYRPALAVTLAGVAGAALLVIRHRENLERLARGTEPRLEWKRPR
jgi:glycerol-3-phosphate acyltransferase PlsY